MAVDLAHWRGTALRRASLAPPCRRRRPPIAAAAAPAPDAARQQRAPQPAGFLWRSSLSRRLNLDLAVEEACRDTLEQCPEAVDADLALVFLSSAYSEAYERLLPQLLKHLPGLRHLAGSSGYGVVGGSEGGPPDEVEHAPALSLTLARLPGVSLRVSHVVSQDLPDGDALPSAWEALVGVAQPEGASAAGGAAASAAAPGSAGATQPPAAGGGSAASEAAAPSSSAPGGGPSGRPPSFVVLAEPTFTRVEDLLQGLDYAFPRAVVVGGLASSGEQGSLRGMFVWSADWAEGGPRGGLLRTGAVVLALAGPLLVQPIVAQGCRPLNDRVYTVDEVGPAPNMVAAARDARGRSITPVQALQVDLAEQAATQQDISNLLSNLTLGLAPAALAASDQLEAQDFLIRGCAFDRSGVMVVGDEVRPGMRYRFMVRDREGAQADLHAHGLAYKRRELAAMMGGGGGGEAAAGAEPAAGEAAAALPPVGALIFSCNGRGSNLYEEPSWDSRTLASYVPVPLAGFLCNGEIGGVGGGTRLLGFTASIALFRPLAATPPSSLDASAPAP